MSAGAVSSRSAARSRPRWITTSAARFRVVPLMMVEDEPPVPPPCGIVRVSPWRTSMRSTGTPSACGEDLGEHRLVPLALALRAGMGDQPVGRDLRRRHARRRCRRCRADGRRSRGRAACRVASLAARRAAKPGLIGGLSAPSRTGAGSRRRRRCSRWPPRRACRPAVSRLSRRRSTARAAGLVRGDDRPAARAGTAPRACRRRGSHRPARCW